MFQPESAGLSGVRDPNPGRHPTLTTRWHAIRIPKSKPVAPSPRPEKPFFDHCAPIGKTGSRTSRLFPFYAKRGRCLYRTSPVSVPGAAPYLSPKLSSPPSPWKWQRFVTEWTVRSLSRRRKQKATPPPPVCHRATLLSQSLTDPAKAAYVRQLQLQPRRYLFSSVLGRLGRAVQISALCLRVNDLICTPPPIFLLTPLTRSLAKRN